MGDIPLRYIARAGEAATWGSVADRLVSAMAAAGYHDYSFMPAPGGYAIVTQLERIRENGTPVLHQRFGINLNSNARRIFSIGDYLSALFTADVGYYRVIVFLITPEDINTDGPQRPPGEILNWRGFDRLPVALRANRFDPAQGYRCKTLVYEFTKDQFAPAATLTLHSPVAAVGHLEKAGIWHVLAR